MSYRKLLPILAALVTFLVTAIIGLGMGGIVTARLAIAERQRIALYADEVATSAANVLHALNKSYRPSCDEDNLRTLRQMVYLNIYVSDIGILDQSNHLVCTTTLGVLDHPIPALTPEYSINMDGEEIFITDSGKDYLTREARYNTRGRLKQFQVTVAPYAIAQMRAGNFSAVGYISQDNQLKLIRGTIKEKGSAADIAELTERQRDWRKNMLGWSFKHLALEMSIFVPTPKLVYFHRAPIFANSATSHEFKFWILLAALLMAIFAYSKTVSILIKNRTVAARIKRLLKIENLRCLYQPIIALENNRIIGCEVLVRLQDGNKLRTPDQFLPAALESGLGWQLDQLVIKQSLTQLKEGLPKDIPFKIAINLFPQNIKAKQLHELIYHRLGWDPKTEFTINLEVIEQHYQDDMLVEIAELKHLGYHVSVDDFGTGFSNLASVRKLQPDYLKIDRSFVYAMEAASVRSSLIPEIISIARASGAALIAEGIENEQQRDALKELGVEYGQGYFFGRPMPLANLIALLSEQSGKDGNTAE